VYSSAFTVQLSEIKTCLNFNAEVLKSVDCVRLKLLHPHEFGLVYKFSLTVKLMGL
jgi:hypothetical protein